MKRGRDEAVLRSPDEGVARAVDGVTLSVRRGSFLAIVGESGCGKTTASRCILRAIEPTGGEILYKSQEADGVVDIASLGGGSLRALRREIQMIFQDPYSSLNPRMTVGAIIEEPLKIHTKQSKAERRDRVHWLLEKHA